MLDEFIFENPPKAIKGRKGNLRNADAIRILKFAAENPNKWFKIGEFDRRGYERIMASAKGKCPEIKFTQRMISKNFYGIWVRLNKDI